MSNEGEREQVPMRSPSSGGSEAETSRMARKGFSFNDGTGSGERRVRKREAWLADQSAMMEEASEGRKLHANERRERV